ncbi:hydroxymethylglutaryl-CoA lyase [Murinocardiopsis flavida]|uniref:Hydroxymethylglutaryl-CoA lyase n=1 Tax=Murinocardiopsis flavida TaxID=645275 RepID=A0A2P8CXK6_9ACTN|nr:hydroxymethylglutaryl-CoA lyase [Murinocardiopsis flavida]PSK89679.1 hydroxymethylglutaryl-CoA lyase [Murinocardiopsis flavida]
MGDDVVITEVCLRDGLQIEPVVVPTEEKLRLCGDLVDAGFRHLEIGAFVHPGRVPTMADTAEVVAGSAGLPATLHTLVLNEQGARRAVAAGARAVRLVVSASDGHSSANGGVPTDEAAARIERAAAVLRDAGIPYEGCVATAFHCPFDGPTPEARVAAVAEMYARIGVRRLHLADTIGAASPGDIARTVAAVRGIVGADRLGLHLHNTYGMAAANAWEAYRLGVRRFDAALGGLGGCPFAPGATGNIATDDLVHLFHREGIGTGIDTERLGALRDRLAALVGHSLASALARIPAAPAAAPAR